MALTLKNLVTIFATPTEVFEELRQKPKWLVAFLVISFLTIAIALLSLPFTRQPMLQAISRGGALEGARLEQALEQAERFQYLGSMFIAPTLLLRWLAIAALLYFAAILAGAERVRFKEVYAAAVFAEMILLLMAVVNLLLLHVKGADAIHHITDLQAIIGLDFLMADKTSDLPTFTIFNAVNIFNLWYVAVLSIALRVMSGLGNIKSAILVTSVWLLGVGFQVAMAALSANMQRLQSG